MDRDPNYTPGLVLKRRILSRAPILNDTWERIRKEHTFSETAVIDEDEAKELEALVDRMVEEYLEYNRTNVSEDLEKIPFHVPLPPAAIEDEVGDWRPSWVKFGERCLEVLQDKEKANVFKPFSKVEVKDWFEAADVSLARLNAEIVEIRRQEAVGVDPTLNSSSTVVSHSFNLLK